MSLKNKKTVEDLRKTENKRRIMCSDIKKKKT